MAVESKITKEQVEKIAELVRLTLSDTEIERYSSILTEILAYINVMEELDLSGISPTFQVTGLNNVFLDGEVSTTLSQEQALMNAKEKINGLFATEGVFD